ncbi:hypothetical protein BKA82DRAFT_4186108 [Pisolithus tinctorius]|nr:hypothetical protein BKA82DRAFT_4186108 [Pisolithus tinctorius]
MSNVGHPDRKETDTSADHVENAEGYRLYKRRFSGLLGFIIVTGMQWSWFGPIATLTAEEFNIFITSEMGGVMLLLSAWVCYASTIRSLSPQSAYVLLFFGQLFGAVSRPVIQVLGPSFSERWFDLRTSIIGFSLLAIISTAVLPAILLILESPPSPPTYFGSKQPLSFISLCRAMLGLSVSKEAYMLHCERIDFVILTLVFGVLDGVINALGIFSSSVVSTCRYSDTTCGLLGATLALSGIPATVISARIMGATFKSLVLLVSLAWLLLIWAVKPNNATALLNCCTIILPLVLELGVELTRNANGSSAILWSS